MLGRFVAALVLIGVLASAQEPHGVARIQQRLNRLRTVGSILMIAAHPDDENTALLTYFARGRHLRTAYLSLTRGEGGQNLIGSEQGELMGLIRTQELLAARRLDGAEQFFTRAIDFGFSKTAEETLTKWGRENVLADVVTIVRRFQPDIIVLRFSGTPRDGHGHHQSSAILGKEAFTDAADSSRFPEQLRSFPTWKPRRLFWNTFSFTREMEQEAAAMRGRLELDTGRYDPVLGFSYGEIAAKSRSMHRSQGMGAAERLGSSKNYLTLVAGDPAMKDPLEGIDTTWNRIPGGAPVAVALDNAARAFQIGHPEKMLPALVEARRLISAINHPWATAKLREADELIAEVAGVWVSATTSTATLLPGSNARITATAITRVAGVPARLEGIEWESALGVTASTMPPRDLPDNQPVRVEATIQVPLSQPYTQPYWLRQPSTGTVYQVGDPKLAGQPENPPLVTARFKLRIAEAPVELWRPVVYRWVDPVRGELTRDPVVAPPVAVEFADRAVVFPAAAPKRIEVQVRAIAATASGDLSLSAPSGWRVSPSRERFELKSEGEIAAVVFEITPPATSNSAKLHAVARMGEAEIRNSMRVIAYDHIPQQALFPPATVSLVRTDVKLTARNIGYIMGAGDEVPAALRQLGAEVTLLDADALSRGDLARFDAIVTGVRAYNTRRDLLSNNQRLLEYVRQGGTMVVQYNVVDRGFGGGASRSFAGIAPYPVQFGRDRVSVEEARMSPVKADHPLLQMPNRITASDFDGWVQERGLYFAEKWDSRFEPLWECHDPGEPPNQGSMLYTRYGKGTYIFTGLSWFRQLPAGVPGAYRIFANLLSAGRAGQ
jgi:LmbE family N-acetylglucosaminyl deacetylase